MNLLRGNLTVSKCNTWFGLRSKPRGVSSAELVRGDVISISEPRTMPCHQSHGKARDSMAKLTTDLEKPAQSIKPREIAARSEGAARNALATALIVLGVIVCLFLVWETSANLLVIFAGILFASFLDACARALGPVHARRSCVAVDPGRADPDGAHRVGRYLGSRENSRTGAPPDTRHGCAA